MKRITLGTDLYNRIWGYAVHSCKSTVQRGYAEALSAHEGQVVDVTHEFRRRTGLPYAYTVRLPNGRSYHLPALFTVEDEPFDTGERR